MGEYLLLMHDDATTNDAAWGPYIQNLQQAGFFEGGSVIGDGVCARKSGEPALLTKHLTGYIRVTRKVSMKQCVFWPEIHTLRPAEQWRSANCPGRTREVLC